MTKLIPSGINKRAPVPQRNTTVPHRLLTKIIDRKLSGIDEKNASLYTHFTRITEPIVLKKDLAKANSKIVIPLLVSMSLVSVLYKTRII